MPRVERKGEVTTGGLEGRGIGAESVKARKNVPLDEGITPTKGPPFVEKLFSSLLSEIQGDIDVLQAKVDRAAQDLVAKPNQTTLDNYKEAISHLLAFIIDKSTVIRRAQSLKRGKDGQPKEFVRVEIINEKIAELAKEVYKSQKPMLDLVHRLDEIRGLIVDLYDWKSTR